MNDDPFSPPSMGGPPAMHMVWHDLAFLHWRAPAESIRRLLPAGLELDLWEGEAWVGVVPFRMTGVRPRSCPSVPWLSHFLELNVRTYVRGAGRAGVWFFTLDAAQPVAVRVARATFHLNYVDARMRCRLDRDRFDYRSRRTHRGAPPAELRVGYRPTGIAAAPAGSLLHWLTSRYSLFAADRRGRLFHGAIDHPPWKLEHAEVDIEHNSMANGLGFELSGPPELCHFSRRTDVLAWRLERCLE